MRGVDPSVIRTKRTDSDRRSRTRGGWSPALVGTGPNIAPVKTLVKHFSQNATRSDSLDYISEIRIDYFENPFRSGFGGDIRVSKEFLRGFSGNILEAT